MFRSKILIIIGIIICLVVCYYFWDELSSLKKTIMQSHSKLVTLESRSDATEKEIGVIGRKAEALTRLRSGQDIDSPAMTVTSFNSDMIIDGGLSINYANISDPEAIAMLNKLGSRTNRGRDTGQGQNQGQGQDQGQNQTRMHLRVSPTVIQAGSTKSNRSPTIFTQASPSQNLIQSKYIVQRGELSDFSEDDNGNGSGRKAGSSTEFKNGIIPSRRLYLNKTLSEGSEYGRVLSEFDNDSDIDMSELVIELDPTSVRNISETILLPHGLSETRPMKKAP